MQPIIRFPSVIRDLSLVLPEAVTWAQIEGAIRQLGIVDLRELEFVDIYRGEGVPADKKSLTLSMVFRREDETLRHEQVDGYQEKILAALEESFGARLRN